MLCNILKFRLVHYFLANNLLYVADIGLHGKLYPVSAVKYKWLIVLSDVGGQWQMKKEILYWYVP